MFSFTGRIPCTVRCATVLIASSLLWTAAGSDAAASGGEVAAVRREHAELLQQLERRQPRSPYVVINTRDNRVLLRNQEGVVLRDAVCSTGASRRFEGPKSYHRWEFATPTGRFSVLRKVTDPLWVKPTWAFLEAGEEVPIFAEDRRRFQRGVLGRYALYFAKDYMIHGTLYEINLGKSITHGCVRVGAGDLEYLFDNVELGWSVYAY